MGYRINHIHLKAPDPRKTADWYVTPNYGLEHFGFDSTGLGATLLEGPIQNPNGPRIAFLRGPVPRRPVTPSIRAS